MTEVQTTGETTYARGGRGNAKLVGFSSNREARVTIQDAIFDNNAMAMLTGNAISSAAKNVTKSDVRTINTAGTYTMNGALETLVSLNYLNDDGTWGAALAQVDNSPATGEYTYAANVITLGDTLTENTSFVFYTETAATTPKTITVSSDKFGGTYKVVADVIVRDAVTKEDYYGQFIAYNAKIEDDFTFSFSPDGDPSVMDIPLEILKPDNSTVMWEFVIYDEEVV